MKSLRSIAIVAAAFVLSATGSKGQDAQVPDEIRTPHELAAGVTALAPFGTVLAAVVVDTGADPVLQHGAYSSTRSVTVRNAMVLSIVDGTLACTPLDRAETTVLYPGSLWSPGAVAGSRPAVSSHVLLAAQRVGDLWVAFPEAPARRLAPGLLAASLAASTVR